MHKAGLFFIVYYPAGGWLTEESKSSFELLCQSERAREAFFMLAPFIAEAADLFEDRVPWAFLAHITKNTFTKGRDFRLGGPACLMYRLWVSSHLNVFFLMT